MADLKSPDHPLEVLQAMLNLVLIQTGKLLRDQESYHPRAMAMTRSKVNEFVPPANDRFHDALDEIEMKILDAKAVMERDLSVMRKKRAERIGVKTSAQQISPAQMETDAADLMGASMVDLDALPGGDFPVDQNLDGDLTMLEAAQMDGAADNLMSSINDGKLPEAAKVGDLSVTNPQPAEGSEVQNPSAPDGGAQGGENQDTKPDQNEIPTEFDFDSMFNDVNMGVDDGSMAFDMDFSTTDGGGNPFDNMDLTASALGNANSNEDINSLMPGLDAVVNASNSNNNNNTSSGPNGAATGMSAAQTTSGEAATAPTTGGDAGGQNAAQQPDTAAATTTTTTDSQFDDIFGPGFSLDDAGGTDGIGDFDFDQDWQNLMQ